MGYNPDTPKGQAPAPVAETPLWMGGTGLGNTTIAPLSGNLYQPNVDVKTYLEQMTPSGRKAYSAVLRKAGYDTPKSGVVGPKFIEEVNKFNTDLLSYKTTTDPNVTPDSFLNILSLQNDSGSGLSGGPRTSYKQINDTDAVALINAVMKDAVGRQASEEEIAKYTKMVRKAERANPTVTTYDDSGVVRSSTGGIDEGQFLIQQLAKTDEAKANQILTYYDAFKQALGVR